MGFREKIENNLINPSIQDGDELIGYFNCVLRKDSLKIQLLGKWALFATKRFAIALSKKGIYLIEWKGSQKFVTKTFYEWKDVKIKKIEFKKGWGNSDFLLQISTTDLDAKFEGTYRDEIKDEFIMDKKCREFIESKKWKN